MKIKIIADAVSNLFKNILEEKKLDIKVMNVHLYVDDKEYLVYDDIDDVAEFSKNYYQMMKDGANIRTSLVSPGDYEKTFTEEVEKGNKVICFTMAKGISGTYNSACVARDLVNEKYGEKMVEVIDCMTAGFGEGMQAINAYELVEQGKSFEEVISIVEEKKHFYRSDFVVDNIKYLLKTGRANKVLARFMRFLNIRVLLKRSESSKIAFAGTALGKEKSIKALYKIVSENIAEKDEIVYITHCNCIDDALGLKKLLEEDGITNIEIYDYDVISGAHIGPDSLAVFYLAKEAY